ncbi:MAG: ATP-dependent Clp protease ATP-binding subunit [Planctomycetales bacterium]|nr:ATP-dependent Clp protease ATP-binding subunit [Planctomycetales bacterium]
MSRFDKILGAVVGAENPGSKIVAEGSVFPRTKVQLRDWLYCLTRATGTACHEWLIDRPGQDIDAFVEAIEGGMDEDDGDGMPPMALKKETASADVLSMLQRADQIRQEHNQPLINDAMLALALLDSADEDLMAMLEAWMVDEDQLEAFRRDLLARVVGEVEIPEDFFEEDGTPNERYYSVSGKKVLRDLREDIVSFGAKKVTTRHLLFTLLGDEAGLIHVGLAIRGINVKTEVHAGLSREMTRPGRKRKKGDFQLTKGDTLLDSVVDVLEQAYQSARRRGEEQVGRFDINRSFVEHHIGEIRRLLSAEDGAAIAALQQYVKTADPDDDDEEESPLERYTIKEIEDQLHRRICGQETAIERTVPWVKRLRFGLPRDGRPAAVFLFLGPTGAGKTQLAKELARFVFGDPDKLIFLEMGQFKTKESMSAFIGAPPGYVGYGEGLLTNGLKDKPESVVLFDEIEKASVEVFDVLLRFADEGMINDPAGPVRDGTQCVIVMTTNAGQAWLREEVIANPELRGDTESLPELLLDAARKELAEKGFRPEFLGRVDECISFLPFSVATCRKIVDLVLEGELKKFRDLKGIEIEVSEEARDVMAAKAYARSMDEGARGAPRAVNEAIVTPAIDLLTREEHELNPPKQLIASVADRDQIILEPNE